MRKQFTLALLVAAALAPGLATPAAAASNASPPELEGSVLSLGDSVPFGYNPLIVAAGKAGDPDNFVGFPEIVAQRLELRDVNAACPGETSTGLILLNGPDHGCRPYRHLFPLHVNYKSAQLDYAIKFLQKHDDVRLVTMMVGANDLFLLQEGCHGDPTCEINGLPAVLDTIQANLSYDYWQIRNLGHYSHEIITVNYYAPSTDPLVALALTLLNARLTTVTQAFHGDMADAFTAFGKASIPFGGSPCAAGLLIVTSPGVCDVHPSAKGANLLAATVLKMVDPEAPEPGGKRALR